MSKIVLLSHGLICAWLPILASRGLDIHHVAHRPWDRSLWVSICYRPNLYIKRKLMLCRIRKSMLTSLFPSILPFPNGIFCMTRFQFFQAKRWPERPSGHFFVVLYASKSHLINYSWVTTSKRCKIFHFFSFLLTFGGWDCNHFAQNFMGNNSVKNFKAWKSREVAEKCLWKWTPTFA